MEKHNCKVIVFGNSKGGVLKTSSSLNISCALAQSGVKTLLVDLDALCSATMGLGYDPEKFEKSIADVFNNPEEIVEAVYDTEIENLCLIPSSVMLANVEVQLAKEAEESREDMLSKALDIVKEAFDIIVIDTMPSSLSLVTLSAYVAADFVIITAQTKIQSNLALNMFLSMLKGIKEIKNPKLQIFGVIATLFKKTKEDAEVLQELQENFNVLGIIKNCAAATKQIKDGIPVTFKGKSPIALAYREIAEKIRVGVNDAK